MSDGAPSASQEGESEPDWMEVKDLFADALDLPPTERAGLLDLRCSGRPRLRAEVESLLSEAPDEETGFLEVPAISVLDVPAPEVGAELGGYRLRAVIGEGGMGRVFEATQEHPHRTVALKVLRPGFLSGDAERRFHYEVEALGKLSHEGIARVFDAGVEESAQGNGVSWFAMEKIDGRPFLDAADQLQLDREDRLRLFLKTAEAVGHAHQRGVIHRDLKPDNILVDASGTPKVLDFGIARSLDPHGTTVTSTGEIVGTIAYMSPEQVLGEPSAVDARSDVYALGVLLYRLLTGVAPLELSGLPLPKAAMLLAQGRPTPAGHHDRTLRGDLETVLQKALEHDVDRRYGTVDAFAADVRAVLERKPISARPPTTFYQVHQFARRNRGLVAGLSLALLALVGAVIGTSIGFVRAAGARDVAQLERDRAREANGFLERLLESADPELGAYGVRVVDLLRQASVELHSTGPDGRLDDAVRASMHRTIGQTYLRLGLTEEARSHLSEAVSWFAANEGEDGNNTLETQSSLAEALLSAEDMDAALVVLREVEAATEARGDSLRPSLRMRPLELEVLFAEARGDVSGKLAAAQAVYDRWRTLAPEGSDPVEVARSHCAMALAEAGQADEADALLTEGIELMTRLTGPKHPRLLTQELLRAQIAVEQGAYARAAQTIESLMPRGLDVWGPEHADTLAMLGSYGGALQGMGELERALEVQEDVLERSLRAYGPGHSNTLVARGNVATTSMYAEAFERAADLLEENLRLIGSQDGQKNPIMVLQQEMGLASALQKLERFDEALPLFLRVIEHLREFVDDSHPQLLISRNNLATLYLELDRADDAVALCEEVLGLGLEHQPGNRMNVFPLRSNLGRALAAAGRHGEAIEQLLEVEASLAGDPEATNPEQARVRELLHEVYTAWGRPEEAARWSPPGAAPPD